MQDEDGGEGAEDEDHGPVGIQMDVRVIKADVDAREEGAHDQNQNADIVDAQPERRDGERVVDQCVVARRQTQRHARAEQVQREHKPIFERGVWEVRGEFYLERVLQRDGEEEGDQVREDVEGFVVQVRPGVDAGGGGVADGPVVRASKGVVLVPFGEILEVEESGGFGVITCWSGRFAGALLFWVVDLGRAGEEDGGTADGND